MAQTDAKTATTQSTGSSDKNFKMYIGGNWIGSGTTFDVKSPYDGSLVGHVPVATPEHVDAAISAAAKAFHPALPITRSRLRSERRSGATMPTSPIR